MLKLVISLPYGQIEKRFEYSPKGRIEAFGYLRDLSKKRKQVILHYTMTKIL